MKISGLLNKTGKPLILDGAIGSLLQSKVKEDNPLWSSLANIIHPEKVITLHKEYINAGADMITTNTFRTNYSAYKKSNLKIGYEEFVSRSVGPAIQAKGNKKIIIAGSNAPAEDCYQVERTLSREDLEYNHAKHIELLWESGVDFILNETQSHLDEIKIICSFCSGNKIPFAVSLYLNDDLTLLSGEKLKDAVEIILGYAPLFIGFNCIKDSLLWKIVESMELNFNWGFYLNLGSGAQTSETIICTVTGNDYSAIVKKYLKFNPAVIGACCGSNPSHIQALRKTIDELY
ncbi:MAG: homocysteine S-methyltransferase family protein [Ignavibacteria bacterium]|jgi:homocysteine S-methyltransferase